MINISFNGGAAFNIRTLKPNAIVFRSRFKCNCTFYPSMQSDAGTGGCFFYGALLFMMYYRHFLIFVIFSLLIQFQLTLLLFYVAL